MPIFLSAIIGYVRFVIGQGRKLFWVESSLCSSGHPAQWKPLNEGEVWYFLEKRRDSWRMRDPLPGASWMVGGNWFPLRVCPQGFSLSRLLGGRASHFVPRPQ